MTLSETPSELPQIEWGMEWGGEITERYDEWSSIQLETEFGLRETHCFDTSILRDVQDENVLGITFAIEANQGSYLQVFGGDDTKNSLLNSRSLPPGYTILRSHAVKGSMKVATGGGVQLKMSSDFFGGPVACGGPGWLPDEAFPKGLPIEKEYFFISWVIALPTEIPEAVAEQCHRIGEQVTASLLAQGSNPQSEGVKQ